VLGLVGFAGQIPVFFLAPFAGVWVDRLNQHRILVVTQTLSMLQSFALAFLALKHIITIPEIIALNAFQGLVNAVDIPTRQAFVVKMVENREDLSNAIALNSSMVHAARLVGPAIAGVLIYKVGEGLCFLLDGFSYLAVIAALLAMHVKFTVSTAPRKHPLREFTDGFRYAFGFAPIRTLLMLVAVVSLMAMSQSTLMPIMANKVLHGAERVYGLLLGASGFGAFVGSIYLASRRSVIGLGRVIAIALLTLGAGMIAFSTSRSLWISLPLLTVMGAAFVVQFAACNTVLQTIVDDDKRGRVMSLFAMCFMGMSPFGALLAGMLGDRLGAPRTLAVAGVVCLIAGLFFSLSLRGLRPLVRGIYIKKGILPEVATAMQATESMSAGTQEG
jgi:MFS family permease